MSDFDEYKITATEVYLGLGLSILPTHADKTPALKSWGALQTTKMTQEEANNAFNKSNVRGIGIICGAVSGNLEVVDVDCKYDHTGMLWENLKSLIEDNLPEVLPMLVIAKTVNKGYHLYYRCETIEGNQKLASNPDNTTLIETRGEGGYVIACPTEGYSFIQHKTKDIPTITVEERECLLAICRTFDLQPVKEEVPQLPAYENILSPFDDYNSRADIVSLLKDYGWTVSKESGYRVHLKRPGDTKHPMSANYHREKHLFYVFSTSTTFDAGRAYNPVQVYNKLVCNDDWSEASKKLYEAGYGDRRPEKAAIPSKPSEPLPPTGLLPIEGMPTFIQDFIKVNAETHGTPRDYWAGAVIMATALGIGDKIQLNTQYKNVPILWMNIIGDVSSGKTEAQDKCIKPFEMMDSKAIEQYKIAYEQYDLSESLSAKERKKNGIEHTLPPSHFQYIVKDTTPEALVDIHSINKRGILISRDELKGMLDDFGRYSKSGEQSNMLSSYNRIRMISNRKGGGMNKVLDIPNPCILILGGMQPEIIPQFGGDYRKENGFLARFCHVWPDHTEKPLYRSKKVPVHYDEQWTEYLTSLTQIEVQHNITLSFEAENLYKDWFNQNCKISDKETSGYMKGVYGKLDIMALRLATALFGMKHYKDLHNWTEIQAAEMQAALDITEYFRRTAMKVYHALFGESKSVDTKAMIQYLYTKKHNQTQIGQILGISQQYVGKVLKDANCR